MAHKATAHTYHYSLSFTMDRQIDPEELLAILEDAYDIDALQIIDDGHECDSCESCGECHQCLANMSMLEIEE